MVETIKSTLSRFQVLKSRASKTNYNILAYQFLMVQLQHNKFCLYDTIIADDEFAAFANQDYLSVIWNRELAQTLNHDNPESMLKPQPGVSSFNLIIGLYIYFKKVPNDHNEYYLLKGKSFGSIHCCERYILARIDEYKRNYRNLTSINNINNNTVIRNEIIAAIELFKPHQAAGYLTIAILWLKVAEIEINSIYFLALAYFALTKAAEYERYSQHALNNKFFGLPYERIPIFNQTKTKSIAELHAACLAFFSKNNHAVIKAAERISGFGLNR